MARPNTKNETTAIRFRTIVKTFAFSLVVAVVGLGLVHQHNLHHELADEGKRLDTDLRSVEEKIRQAIRVEAILKSPPVLTQRVVSLELGLVPIQSTQRMYLARSATPLAGVGSPLVTPAAPLAPVASGVATRLRTPPALATVASR